MYNYDVAFVISCSGELSINMVANCNVSTNNRKLNAMGVFEFRLELVMMLRQVSRTTWELLFDVIALRGILLDNLSVRMRISCMIVSVFHTGDDDIVVRVTVVGDECAATQVAGKFKLTGVNLIHRSNDRLSIDLDNGFIWADSGSSNLRINVDLRLDISTGLDKFNTVGAGRLASLWIIFVVSWLVFRLSRIMRGIRVDVASSESVAERNVSLLVLEKRTARVYHLGGESELLAVKNDCISVRFQVILSVVALVLNATDSVCCCFISLTNQLHVSVDIILVTSDCIFLLLKGLADLIHVLG